MTRLLPRAALLLALAWPAPSRAQVNQLPAELEDVGIDDQPGAVVPRDLEFRDQQGRTVRLGDYFDGQHPVVLLLAYYQCPMLCTLVLNGLTLGLRELGAGSGSSWTAGDRFRVVVVSIDPRDTPTMAAAKRDAQLRYYGHPVAPRGWDFLVGPSPPSGSTATSASASVKQLAATVGFRYRWDPQQQQFAHAAGAFVFTPDGHLSRTLYGMQFPGPALRLALVEASAGKLGGSWDRILLFCFHYDPSARGYVLAAERLMKAAGVFTMLGLAAFLGILFRRPGRPPRERSKQQPGPPMQGPVEQVV